MASTSIYRRLPGVLSQLKNGSQTTRAVIQRSFMVKVSPLVNCTTRISLTYSTTSQKTVPLFTPQSHKLFSRGSNENVELRENLTIDAYDFKKAVEKDEVYVVDVRTPEECAEGRIMAKRWVNVPVQEFGEALKLSDEAFEEKYKSSKPQKDAEDIIFHCRSGVRSTMALYAAIDQGYSKARHFPEGWIGWEAHTYPLKDN
uniref:Thiosulfate sulfurtransferase/rhodanese-like domain-containing protein 3 n=1 Tax=Phallusia mammillata TaxID=59560 RepID=A0A6F9DWD7_9ASCI|nr:thiosulfate sulfurtransferase/rhodanese-like domain-containing protein 3 [Phallusia mammillata]